MTIVLIRYESHESRHSGCCWAEIDLDLFPSEIFSQVFISRWISWKIWKNFIKQLAELSTVIFVAPRSRPLASSIYFYFKTKWQCFSLKGPADAPCGTKIHRNVAKIFSLCHNFRKCLFFTKSCLYKRILLFIAAKSRIFIKTLISIISEELFTFSKKC